MLDTSPQQEEIFTDASDSGWGIAHQSRLLSGTWYRQLLSKHINYKELFVIWKVVTSPQFQGRRLRIYVDNTTTMAYVNKFGGTKSPELMDLANKIWTHCLTTSTTISTAFVPSSFNPADPPSRQLEQQLEWSLTQDYFNMIDNKWDPHQMDLFASNKNNKLPRYMSWRHDPSAYAQDALHQPWTNLGRLYICPPWNLLPQVLERLRREKLPATVITPNWTGSLWYPMLQKMTTQPPIDLPRTAVQSLSANEPGLLSKNLAWHLQAWNLKYIRFCQERNLDYSRADPVVLLNFLAWGYTTLRWKCTTVQNYRAHVQYLYPDTTDFDDDPDFSTFFKTLQAMENGSCGHSDYDATPVREELLKWGSNDQLSIEQLTRKVCWLLGMCNFLRPSDIARIDLNQSLLSEPNFLRLCIVRPKETSRGIHRDKHSIVQAHPSGPILCPVNTIRAYLDRHARPILKSPHPTLLDLTINPLIRYTKDATSALASQRISKHIKSLMVLMPLANGSIPKARAAGSTVAALKGVPIDDVITQGNWASHSTYLRFYRISSRTRTDFTTVLLN